MREMALRLPAEVFPPGEYLADELEARGWSQADFADIIGRPVQFVSELINGKKELTAESATQIAAALGSEPSTWLGLQAEYRLWQLAQNPDHDRATARVKLRADLASVIPLAALEKRGDLPRNVDPGPLLAEVMRDFNMAGVDDSPRFCLAAKRANHGDELTLTQRGWLWLALRAARNAAAVRPYDEAGLRLLAEGLARQTAQPEALADLPRRLAAVGVHLVFVEHLPGGKIDGAAFMLDTNPVIAVSGRGKRFDKLFFALMHEIAHVLCGHAQEGALDDAADAASDDPREVEANALAEQLALGGPVTMPAPITAAAVKDKAADLGVHYAFVVGNLQHHRALDWRSTLARGLPNADDVLRSWTHHPLKEA